MPPPQSRPGDLPTSEAAGAKIALRDQIRTARNRLTVAELGSFARGLADVVTSHPDIRRAATVTAYVSVGTEPGTTSLAPARYGLLEPMDRLGLDAIATADVVLVPGQAVSSTGARLGQGGGCYDRALARVPVGTPVVCLLYDDEVGRDVPVDNHDRPVTAAATPTRWVRLR